MSKFGENGVFRTQIKDAKRVIEAVMWDLYFTHKEPFANPLYVPQWSPDYDQIAEWLTDNEGKGLLLAGGVGNGKTMMIRSVLPYIIDRFYGKVVHYCMATQLASDEETKYRKGKRVVLDAVDDIGTEDIRTYYGKVEIPFAMILDEVDQKGGLILASTNMSSEALKAKYGDRTFDRMKKSLKFVLFHGESLRSHPLKADKMDFTQQAYYADRLDDWRAWRINERDEVGERLRQARWQKDENRWREARAKECGLTLKEWLETKATDVDYLRTLFEAYMQSGGAGTNFAFWLCSHDLQHHFQQDEQAWDELWRKAQQESMRGRRITTNVTDLFAREDSAGPSSPTRPDDGTPLLPNPPARIRGIPSPWVTPLRSVNPRLCM